MTKTQIVKIANFLGMFCPAPRIVPLGAGRAGLFF